MRIAYKVFPLAKPSPIYPGKNFTWTPLLNVALMYNHVRSARFEAVVDSGSPWCLFHADVAKAIKIDLTTGLEDTLGGVIGGAQGKMWFHKVKICLPGTMLEVVAGFSPTLSVAGLLGRSGFFDNYSVTFDPCTEPPGMNIERIARA